MTCEEYAQTANQAVFITLVHNLSLPMLVASSAARRTAASARDKHVTLAPDHAEMMLKAARELEDAAGCLREAAATAKPALRLVAAE